VENHIIVLAFEEEPNNIEAAFSQPTKAENFLETVLEWQESGLVELEDVVVVMRGVGEEVKIKQTQSLSGKYALGGAGIGLLAGMLIGGPIGGVVVGSVVGAISGKMKDLGIDNDFIEQTSQGLPPNSSALFLLGKSTDREKMLEKLRPYKAFVAVTTLDEDKAKALKQALSREE